MTKSVHDDVLDGALNIIKTNCTSMLVCNGLPTDRADALAKALATQAMVAGDFTAGNGDVSGRKLAVAAKSGISVTGNGTGDHVALIDGSRLLYANDISNPQTLTSGNTCSLGTWDIELADPA